MALQKFQSNDKLSRKVMSSNYQTEQTFMEVSCSNNIRTGEKGVWECHF